MSDEKLHECPFCGAKAVWSFVPNVYEEDSDSVYWQICCDRCSFATPAKKSDYETQVIWQDMCRLIDGSLREIEPASNFEN